MDNLLSWDKDSKPELLNVSSGIREETNITSENIGDEHHTGATGRAHIGKSGLVLRFQSRRMNMRFNKPSLYLFIALFISSFILSFISSFLLSFIQ